MAKESEQNLASQQVMSLPSSSLLLSSLKFSDPNVYGP